MKRPFRLFLLIGFALLAMAAGAGADDITLVPRLSLKGEYDDNVLFSRVIKESDYVLIVSPDMAVDWLTERGNIKGQVAIDMRRHRRNKGLNTTNQSCGLGAGYGLSERVRTRGHVGYVRDTTLDSQLQETGVVTFRQQRESYDAGTGLTYRLSGLAEVDLDLFYRQVNYDGPSLGYESYKATLQYSHLMASGKRRLRVNSYYDHYQSEASQVDSYGLIFGLTHSFSETLSLSASLGVRYSEVDYRLLVPEVYLDRSQPPFFFFRTAWREIEERHSNWNSVADISFEKRGETHTFRAGYKQDWTYSSAGDPLEVNRIYCDFRKPVTGKLTFGLSATGYRSRSEGRIRPTGGKYLSFSPTLNYRLSERHYMQLGYRYAASWDDTLENDKRVDRSIFWISVGLMFPSKW